MAKTIKHPKSSRKRKLLRVAKKRFLKPLTYAVFCSFMIYLIISNITLYHKAHQPNKPTFVITRLSDTFEETEFMYMLLVTQEMIAIPPLKETLIDFINKPYPADCPKFLEVKLLDMNWSPLAFHIRMQKLFEIKNRYDRYILLGQTAQFLSEEIDKENLTPGLLPQVQLLNEERNKLRATFSNEEFRFIESYHGFAQSLMKL